MSGEREALTDELAGWPIGSGYYRTSVAVGEAQDMADALIAAGWSRTPAPADATGDLVRAVEAVAASIEKSHPKHGQLCGSSTWHRTLTNWPCREVTIAHRFRAAIAPWQTAGEAGVEVGGA